MFDLLTVLALLSATPARLDTIAPIHKLRAGTAVTLVLAQELRTRQVKTGMRVACRAAQTVMADSCVGIPAGSPAVAEVVEARNAGMLGRPDKLVLSAISVTAANGLQIPLRGTFSLEGEDKMIESLASSQVISCLFFLVPGDRVVLGEGTGWTAQVGWEFPFSGCQSAAR